MEGNGLSPVDSGRTWNRERGLGLPGTPPQKKQREDAQAPTGDWGRAWSVLGPQWAAWVFCLQPLLCPCHLGSLWG